MGQQMSNPTPEPTSKGEAASEQWLDELLYKFADYIRHHEKTGIGGPDNQHAIKQAILRQRDTQLIAKLRELGPKYEHTKTCGSRLGGMCQCGHWRRNRLIDQYETLFQQIERGEV
jgi:hypothetical protein